MIDDQIEYTKLSDSDLLHELGMDGKKWADAFRQLNPKCNVADGTMLGWFCNAIMAGYDAASGGGPICGDHAQYLLDKAKL